MPAGRPTDRGFEARLEALREEAGRTGTVAGRGIAIAGGPIPSAAGAPVAYYGQPIVKAPCGRGRSACTSSLAGRPG
jgi:hypothetical protein